MVDGRRLYKFIIDNNSNAHKSDEVSKMQASPYL